MVITIFIKIPVFVDSFFFTTMIASGATLHNSHSTPDILVQEVSASTNISPSKPTAKKSSSSDCYMIEIGFFTGAKHSCFERVISSTSSSQGFANSDSTYSCIDHGNHVISAVKMGQSEGCR